MRLRFVAPSRLHFGSFSLPQARPGRTFWPDRDGNPTLPARHFGGVGLMIDRPGIELTVSPARSLTVEGLVADRACAFAQRMVDTLPWSAHIKVERCPPEHVGLGTGTQLALSVGYAIHAMAPWGRMGVPFPAIRIGESVGRGQRSAIGIHGFEHGGFLVEAGKDSGDAGISPLVCRHDFPQAWSVLLVIPSGVQGIHGGAEKRAFDQLASAGHDLRRTEALCRLVLLGMVPALVTQDLDGFGEAAYDFNRRVGETFAPWQGGIYSHPRVAEIVSAIRRAGIRGVGQSSWGPTVFAISTSDQAHDVALSLLRGGVVAEEELVLTEGSRGVKHIGDEDGS